MPLPEIKGPWHTGCRKHPVRAFPIDVRQQQARAQGPGRLQHKVVDCPGMSDISSELPFRSKKGTHIYLF